MDTPNINTIKAMPKDELDALNRKTMRLIARNALALTFIKIAVPKVLALCLVKAAAVAAKRS